MKFYFGENQIVPNEQINFQQFRNNPVVESEPNEKFTTILLYNTTTRFIHWFNYIDKDLLPYIPIYNNGRYRLMVFDGPLTHNLKRDNLSNYTSKDFGKIVGKIDFYLTGFNTLPKPVRQRILLYAGLPAVVGICSTDIETCDFPFILTAAKTYLTEDPDQLDYERQVLMDSLIAVNGFIQNKDQNRILSTFNGGYEKLIDYVELSENEDPGLDQRVILLNSFVESESIYLLDALLTKYPNINTEEAFSIAVAKQYMPAVRLLMSGHYSFEQINDELTEHINQISDSNNIELLDILIDLGAQRAAIEEAYNSTNNEVIREHLRKRFPDLEN